MSYFFHHFADKNEEFLDMLDRKKNETLNITQS